MQNRERKQLADLFDRYNLKPHVQNATHLAGHILDLVISGLNDDLVMACETDSLLSDHHVVHCKLKIGRPHQLSKEVSFRNVRKIVREAFSSDITYIMASSESSDIKSLVCSYNRNLKTLLDKHAPLITRSFVERPFCPWMTDEIKEAWKAKRKREVTWRKAKLPIHREMNITDPTPSLKKT